MHQCTTVMRLRRKCSACYSSRLTSSFQRVVARSSSEAPPPFPSRSADFTPRAQFVEPAAAEIVLNRRRQASACAKHSLRLCLIGSRRRHAVGRVRASLRRASRAGKSGWTPLRAMCRNARIFRRLTKSAGHVRRQRAAESPRGCGRSTAAHSIRCVRTGICTAAAAGVGP